MFSSLRRHWPEYGMEAAGLGFFMVAACAFAVIFEHPSSPLHRLLPPFPRHLLNGIAMGLTAVAIIYSPWGQQSGAHINPAVTFTFFRLKKIRSWDALFYVLAQFTGAALGVGISVVVLRSFVTHPNVNYVATVPGASGVPVAFAAELIMGFLMMTLVLHATNSKRLAPLTGLFVGMLVATFITFEAPLSGMSINPARTFGSALSARLWTAFWLYLTAPTAGMILASELYRRRRANIVCAKLHHQNDKRCIFHCGFKGA